MRTNPITEHFPKIVKDYMVTSFTGQKLDQSFGDQHWEFPDAGGLMQVLEAIADVAEDLIKDYEERLGNLTKVVEINQNLVSLESEMDSFTITEPIPLVGSPEVITSTPEPEPKVRKKRGPNKKKPCVACEGSGNNSKGEICPICKPTETKPEPVVDETNLPPVLTAPIPPNTPPWLAPKVEPLIDNAKLETAVVNSWEEQDKPTAPAFFPPPPPPPFWNPNA